MEQEQLVSLIKTLKKNVMFINPSKRNDSNLEVDPATLLPHRPPFLLIDKVTKVNVDTLEVEGKRWLNPEDPLFQGHFPGSPIYPGVLQIEMIAQLGLCLANYRKIMSLESAASQELIKGFFLKVHHALFISASYPGDELCIKTKIVDENPFTIELAGQICRGDEIISLSIVEAYINE